ncbi:MAG: formylglycine-generating enzyme family protein [Planctomycetia bacterium]|nr:formylglycine-generating enzyme family protein [Planctomycetia bacterium]
MRGLPCCVLCLGFWLAVPGILVMAQDEEVAEDADFSFSLGDDDSQSDDSEDEEGGFSFPAAEGDAEPSDTSVEDSGFSFGSDSEEETSEETPNDTTDDAAEVDFGFPLRGSEAGERAALEIDGVTYPFRWCPAGKFTMGSPRQEPFRKVGEVPHEVEFSEGFWMLETEVTVEMFSQFVKATSYVTDAEKSGGFMVDYKTGEIRGPAKEYHWKAVGFRQRADFPVVNVSWRDAQAFCEWLNGRLSEKAGGKKAPLSANLPTESQWEYACRSGQSCTYGVTNEKGKLSEYANLRDEGLAQKRNKYPGMEQLPWTLPGEGPFLYTSPGKQFLPNDWGIYDMLGNVWEWCRDVYAPYDTSVAVAKNPKGPEAGALRVYRGGSWNSSFRYARSAARGSNPPGCRHVTLGMRLVLEFPPEGEKEPETMAKEEQTAEE